jgi:hypothetical protein
MNGTIWSIFLKYLANLDLIPIFSGQIGLKPKRLVVPFNNLTVLSGLTMLMESAPSRIAPRRFAHKSFGTYQSCFTPKLIHPELFCSPMIQARSLLSISGGALQKECNRGVGMILTFVLAASFPFQLRKIGIERNVLLHFKSIILVLNFVSL